MCVKTVKLYFIYLTLNCKCKMNSEAYIECLRVTDYHKKHPLLTEIENIAVKKINHANYSYIIILGTYIAYV